MSVIGRTQATRLTTCHLTQVCGLVNHSTSAAVQAAANESTLLFRFSFLCCFTVVLECAGTPFTRLRFQHMPSLPGGECNVRATRRRHAKGVQQAAS